MSATALPPSGDAPAPKTCDASGMIEIHRMFRRSFGEGADGGAEWMHKHLPPPVRVLWRWVGRPKYVRHRAAIEGR